MQNKGLAFEEPAGRPTSPMGDRSGGGVVAARSVSPPVLDPEALATLQQLDPTGASGFIERVLTTFQSSAARLAEKLVEARRVGDRKSIHLVVHTLRSSAAHVGASTLAGLCHRIETAIMQASSADLDPDLDALGPALDLTLTAIRQRLDSTA